jgi:HSP20 family molecular chaperone IbpA
MLSHFWDPFIDDPLLGSRMNRLRLGDNTNQQSTALSGPNSMMMNPRLSNAEDAGWLNFNRLLDEPLQLELQNKDKEYELIAKRPPGIRRKDLHLEVNSNILTISGERQRSRHKKDMDREDYVSFSRSMTLPDDIHLDQIKATYDENDNLHVLLPKLEGRGPRQIPIGGGNMQSLSSSSKADNGNTNNMMQTDKTLGNMNRANEPRSTSTNTGMRNQ